jgi:hypothetical protein
MATRRHLKFEGGREVKGNFFLFENILVIVDVDFG